MKTLKKVMALVIAMVMVIAMAVPTMATGTDTPVAANDGKITINSPIMGAKYTGYKVFDLEMNDAKDAFSYTIKKDSPFYQAVVDYANAADTTDADGLTLTDIASDPNTVSVTASGAFNAQTFGNALKAKIADGIINGATVYDPTYESGKDCVTVATAKSISFENLPYGYYLILNDYPTPISTVTITDAAGTEHEITKNSTAAEKKAVVDACVAAATTDDAIQTYIDTNGLKDHDEDGNEIPIAKDSDAWNSVKEQLTKSTREDAELKIEQALNQIAASESDDNAMQQRMVFVDSTTPVAVINEKNEEHKWDVPVNPTGAADLEGLPEHGEPEGGKNIVIKEATDTTPAVYADWTEANIGDTIHYQLSINATNFERDSSGNVKQISEYIIADYQNKNMTFDESKGLKVTIVKKEADGSVTAVEGPTDYTEWSDKFFKNDNKTDLASGADVLTAADGTGLAISWVDVTKDKTVAEASANVTTQVIDKKDSEGHIIFKEAPADAADGTYVEEDGGKYLIDTNGQKIPETEEVYYISKYENDVTILVDYYMTLENTATIDGNGNVNYSQYGVNFTEPSNKNYEYEPVKPDEPDDREPTEKKDKDDATVYTYALALHKVDQDDKDLAGAKFKALGLTVTKQADGWYKVKNYNPESTEYGDELVTDEKGLLVIEGLSTSATLTFMETEAPEGYNKLAETIDHSATKLSEEVITTSTVTKYDKDGKVTEDDTQVTKTETVITTIDSLKAAAYKVVNRQGQELPETGGIGTTLFYIVGAILVIGAGVVLITRRRMSVR